MPRSMCPACGEPVNVPGAPVVGDKVTCPACAVQLQVVWDNPLELDWADYAEGEVADIVPDDESSSADEVEHPSE